MNGMTYDVRPLHLRVKALANWFGAIASGAEKRAQASLQDAANARRDAATLHAAAEAIARTVPSAPAVHQGEGHP